MMTIRAQEPSRSPHTTGVELATVTNIDALNQGRVKVKFFSRVIDDDILVKIITSEKGKRPEIEVHDVVLVAFEQGHFENAFILGFVYPNLKNKN